MQKIQVHEDGSYIGVESLSDGGAKLSIIDFDDESDLPIPQPMSQHFSYLTGEQKEQLIKALQSA
jgi:hypothetical protein